MTASDISTALACMANADLGWRRRTGHEDGKVARRARGLLGVLALAEVALDGEDDGGPAEGGSLAKPVSLRQPLYDSMRCPGAGFEAAPVSASARGEASRRRKGATHQPTNLLRVNMAAMGMVEASVEANSGLSPAAAGS